MFKHIGSAVCTLALCGGVALAQGAESWSAIALGSGKTAKVSGLPSQQAALGRAKQECGGMCMPVAIPKGSCGAIAANPRGRRFTAIAATLQMAETEALSKCAAVIGRGGGACSVGVSACNQ